MQDNNHAEAATTACTHIGGNMDCLGPGRPKWRTDVRKPLPVVLILTENIDKNQFYKKYNRNKNQKHKKKNVWL